MIDTLAHFIKRATDFTIHFVAVVSAVLIMSIAASPTVATAASSVAGLKTLKPTRVGDSREVTLGLDKSLVVQLPRDARDVLVANPEVADAIVRTARKVFLIGNRVGQTNVFIFDKAGNTILSMDLRVERDIGPLAELIEKHVPGAEVEVEIANDNVILTGRVPNPLAARRAADLAQAFVTGGEATTGQFTQTATGTNGDAAISNPDQGRAVSRVINLLQIDGEDQVHLKVVVAEIKRSVLKQLGVDISQLQFGQSTAINLVRRAVFGGAGFSQNGGLGVGTNGGIGNNFSFQGVVDALERSNVMRTLAEPTLTAQSGREATFLAGGEIEVVTGSTVDDNNVVTVERERRPLGVSLSFTPVVQSAERISITMNTEVSSIDATNGSTFAGSVTSQAISVRRASSTIELPSGGTMIVGGMIREELRQGSSGIPYIRNLPILGALFNSNNFIRNETELVIMVTPYLVRPTARKNLTRPDKNYTQANDAKNFLFNKLHKIYGGGQGGAKGGYHGRVGFIYD